MKKPFLLLLFMLCFANSLFATDYYLANNPCSGNAGWSNGSDSNNGLSKASPFLTFTYAVGRLSANDTLIVDNGTYAGFSSYTTRINGGTGGGYTTIKAENDGMVVIDGGGSATCIELSGTTVVDGNTNLGNYDTSYLIIRGFLLTGSSGNGIQVQHCNHIKVINCGVYDNSTYGMRFSYSEYSLVEGCYSYGASARYGIAFYHTHNSIIRNCVVRKDVSTYIENELADYVVYSSVNVEVQNCISIDSDQQGYYDIRSGTNIGGSFSCPTTDPAPATTGPVNFRNCIGLNTSIGRYSSLSRNAYTADIHFYNCIGAGIELYSDGTDTRDLFHAYSDTEVQTSTFVNITKPEEPVSFGYFTAYYSDSSISGSIMSYFPTGVLFYCNSGQGTIYDSNNCLYSIGTQSGGGGVTSELTKTYDPFISGLEYLPRTETGSQLKTDGIGANILYQFGATGTIWGEAGYNLLQDGTNGQATVELWPFPNEAIIKTNMAAYSYDSGNLSGARGFCATGTRLDGVNPITLTSYIWEYLGNEIPADIYGADPVYDTPTITGPNDFSTTSASVEIEGTYTVDSELTVDTVTWTLGESSGFCVAALGVFSCTVPVELGTSSIVFEITDSNSGTANDSITITRTIPGEYTTRGAGFSIKGCTLK